jgi:hypothetical protein
MANLFDRIEDAAGRGYHAPREEINRVIGRLGYNDAEAIQLVNIYGDPTKWVQLLMDGTGKLRWNIV